MKKGEVSYLNPENLHMNPAFTNVVTVTGHVKTIYIGGQDAVDASGKIVGKGDLKRQVFQVFKNIQEALKAAGAGLEHVIKWNVYLVEGQSLEQGFEVFQEVWGSRPNPPAITGMFVSGLANPDFLVEMDVVAVLPLDPID
ncbi:MAG: RidA family protein [Methanobacteriaceae archaeon]|jgi:enamine deaminase RidA (YjgF/YER057c/UK114 family)|nr:RidA family protein [Methanobacteriaceae archaeon]OPY22251.1 MAG: RutC family protein [Methanobacterium sp. PtaU1.Bin097]